MSDNTMKTNQNVYAFISYASEDRSLAQELYRALRGGRNQIPCWLDVMNISSDETSFQQQIVWGIKNASCLVLVDTEDARLSDYVQRELETARKHHIPIIHFKKRRAKRSFAKKWQLFWLAQRIRFRVTQPYWVSLSLLITLLLLMVALVSFLGSKTVPAVREVSQRLLPDVVWLISEEESIEIDPKTAAPFLYDPPIKFLSDDFNAAEGFDEDYYDYGQFTSEDLVHVYPSEGNLNLFISNQCLYNNDCYIGQLMNGPRVDLGNFQYFGFRLRSIENNPFQFVNISLAIKNISYISKGFGWEFNDHANAFFRSDAALPESGFTSSILLDGDWHAYEILVDDENQLLHFYLDGKLVNEYAPRNYDEWKTAPLHLRFAIEKIFNTEQEQFPDTYLQIDQIVIGGFPQD